MGKRNIDSRFDTRPAEAMAEYQDDCEDELLDAVVTAAVLVARADGRIEEVERGQLLDFLYRKRILSPLTPAELLDVFDRKVRELSEPAGASSALRYLKQHEDMVAAILLVSVAASLVTSRRADPVAAVRR